jgi:membrane associated rhomboid family serine protease
MVLFPYKADVDLGRLPLLTIAVCVTCVWVFVRQEMSQYAHAASLDRYCNQELSRDERMVARYLRDVRHYCDALLEIRSAPNRARTIRQFADAARPLPFYRDTAESAEYVHRTLVESTRRFESEVPPNLTERLHFDPNHPTLISMLTAAFSHGDWWHLISNLVFFFAFAASVEVIAGHWYYVAFIAFSAVGTHLAYGYSVRDVEGAVPTVGLSGVVMAMMAFLATIAPMLRIRCVFWFLIIVRVFRVPALVIAALYIVQNIFDYVNRDPDSNVNYVAHISGAVSGILFGAIYRLRHRQYLRRILGDV